MTDGFLVATRVDDDGVEHIVPYKTKVVVAGDCVRCGGPEALIFCEACCAENDAAADTIAKALSRAGWEGA